jgi:hypothetical protein
MKFRNPRNNGVATVFWYEKRIRFFKTERPAEFAPPESVLCARLGCGNAKETKGLWDFLKNLKKCY